MAFSMENRDCEIAMDFIKKHSERWRWLGTSKYSDGSGFLNAKDNTLRVNIKSSTVDKFSNAIEMNLSNILVCTFYKLATSNLKKSHLYPISWTPLKLIYQFYQSKIFFYIKLFNSSNFINLISILLVIFNFSSLFPLLCLARDTLIGALGWGEYCWC